MLVVDPGKVTGYGFMDWVPGDQGSVTFTGGELPHDDFVDWSWGVLVARREEWAVDRVLCEGFSVNQRTVKECPTDQEMWPVKQIGLLETWCRWGGKLFQRCMPGDKSFDKDGAKLRRLGWWEPAARGERGHRRDAGRHAVKWAVDHNIIDRRALLP
jgi:hypothetical protein